MKKYISEYIKEIELYIMHDLEKDDIAGIDEKLSEFDTPATNDFSQEVADPLMENQLLLKIYKGFMVGG